LELDRGTVKTLIARLYDIPTVVTRSGKEFDTVGKTHYDAVLDVMFEALEENK